jgi:hypothetical protein
MAVGTVFLILISLRSGDPYRENGRERIRYVTPCAETRLSARSPDFLTHLAPPGIALRQFHSCDYRVIITEDNASTILSVSGKSFTLLLETQAR